MEGIVVLLVLMGVLFVLSGPVAFIIAIACLNRLNRLEGHIDFIQRRIKEPLSGEEKPKPASVENLYRPVTEVTGVAVDIESLSAKDKTTEAVTAPQEMAHPKAPEPAMADKYSQMITDVQKHPGTSAAKLRPVRTVSLEQTIGTRGILIAGVIIIIVGVCFFLKYAYDREWLGPWVQVSIMGVTGLLVLILGEVTRRRGYEVVAKGTAALGFVLIYSAVYLAFLLNLVTTAQAFGGAIVVVATAMIYAVTLDEVLIAFLSLVGGFLTPVIVQTGKNLPHHLFGYVVILSGGAVLCAFWRRWRAVNITAFIGTFVLYTLWFEKFVRDALPYVQSQENVIRVAECWLGVLFILYLILPLLYGFIKGVQAHRDDIIIPAAAGIVTFYYLWTMLEEFYRTELAICAASMGAMYLLAAGVSLIRCREDKDLRNILFIAGIAFITTALPLYYESNALVVGWTAEAVILIGAGVIYSSFCAQALGFIVTALSIVGLYWIEQHEGNFIPIFNSIFGTWIFVTAGPFVSHLFYRRKKETDGYRLLSEVLFLTAAVVLFTACYLEWQSWCDVAFSQQNQKDIFTKGILCLLTIYGILLTATGLFYRSILIRMAGILAAGISVLGLLGIFGQTGIYHPVVNSIFGTWVAVGAGIGICGLLYRYWREPRWADYDFWKQWLFIAAVGVLIGACCLEWHRFWSHQEIADDILESLTLRGVLCFISVFMLMMIIRPLSPGGVFCRGAAVVAAGIAGFSAIVAAEVLYCRDFPLVLNTIFPAHAAPAAACFIAAILLWKQKQTEDINPEYFRGFALTGVVLLWIILSQHTYLYWYCLNKYGAGLVDWEFRAKMSLSLLWAGYGALLLIIGFWKQLVVIRYMALGLFGLLLAKIFIVDMNTVKGAYRITAFLATGLTLVGVSYLYQFLKKKGFFDKLLAGQRQGINDKT